MLRDDETIQVPVTLGSRPSTSSRAAAPSLEGPVSARQAIGIAVEATSESLTGDIEDRVATQETQAGREVWVVELSTADQTATVIIDRLTGEVLEANVE